MYLLHQACALRVVPLLSQEIAQNAGILIVVVSLCHHKMAERCSLPYRGLPPDPNMRHWQGTALPPQEWQSGTLCNIIICLTRICLAGRGAVPARLLALPPKQAPLTELQLQQLEALHRIYDLYIWLAFRLEGAFPDRALVAQWRAQCANMIQAGLEGLGRDPEDWCAPLLSTLAVQHEMMDAVQHEMMDAGADDADVPWLCSMMWLYAGDDHSDGYLL